MQTADEIALKAAFEIEKALADRYPGGDVQRRARFQIIVREAIKDSLSEFIAGLASQHGRP